MPKAKGGRKKKVFRPVVLPSLSDAESEDPAPASVPAPVPAPDEVQDEPLVSSSPMELEGLTQVTQESDSQRPAKKHLTLRPLTLKEEENMAEWLQSNPCLYNKKLESYRKADMKKILWVDKAAEFTNIDVDYLLGWYKSIITHFRKLSKIPSGSVAQNLTDRDAGILSKFAFLKTFISRQRGMQLSGQSIKNQLDFKNLLLFHIHMYYCITLILSNPCFVLLY